MKGFLNNNQITYVLFHLGLQVTIPAEMRNNMHFVRNRDEINGLQNKILFLLSDSDLEINRVVNINTVPVLFPVDESGQGFYLDDRGNLVFCQDFLKSAFYLLSGYQEYANQDSKDNLKRFSFDDSIQFRLKFVQKPVVNYYFEILAEGLEAFGEKQGWSVKRRRLFQNFGFLLTHDIDKIDYVDGYYLGYKLKELVGFRKSRLRFSENLGILFKGLLQWLHFTKQNNPYWNFIYLRSLERERDLRSTFFFLDQGIKHSDAYYSFSEPRMKELFRFLIEEKCEIGLHGTVSSIDNAPIMSSSLKKLADASGATVTGIRQHRLLWKHPRTAMVQQSIGLEYDCTLGFAAHEGFRNSYCLPFMLYDFEKDRAIDTWEFPLNVMDGTLFAYQNYSVGVAMEKCLALVSEISRFGGVFDLLWHNSFFDEQTYPGVSKFYVDLLDSIKKLEPENVLGSEMKNKMNAFASGKATVTI